MADRVRERNIGEKDCFSMKCVLYKIKICWCLHFSVMNFKLDSWKPQGCLHRNYPLSHTSALFITFYLYPHILSLIPSNLLRSSTDFFLSKCYANMDQFHRRKRNNECTKIFYCILSFTFVLIYLSETNFNVSQSLRHSNLYLP